MSPDKTMSFAEERLKPTIFVATIFTLFMAIVFGFGIYLFSILATDMQKDLKFSYFTIGLVTGAAQLTFMTAALLCSSFVNRLAAGQLITLAVIIAGILLMMLSIVESTLQMAVILTALGGCAALMVIPTVGVVSTVVPFSYRSSVNGLISSGTAYGQLASGLIVPFFIIHYDWRMLWAVIGIVSILIAFIGYLLLRWQAPLTFQRQSQSPAAHSPEEKRGLNIKNIPRITSARNLKVWGLLAISGMACGPWQNYLSIFLRNEAGYSITLIGQLWSIIGILGLGSGFALGLLADKIGVRWALIMSYAVLSVAATAIAYHNNEMTLRFASVCFGLSFYAVYGLIPAYISKTSTSKEATIIFAIANICLGVGTSFGNVTGGYLQEILGSFHGTYLSIAVISLSGAGLTLSLADERTLQTRRLK